MRKIDGSPVRWQKVYLTELLCKTDSLCSTKEDAFLSWNSCIFLESQPSKSRKKNNGMQRYVANTNFEGVEKGAQNLMVFCPPGLNLFPSLLDSFFTVGL